MYRPFPAIYTLPTFPLELQRALSKKDGKELGPGSKFKRMLVQALHDDLQQRRILYVAVFFICFEVIIIIIIIVIIIQ